MFSQVSYSMLSFCRLGKGDGKMSSMMFHCFKQCVIKMILPLSQAWDRQNIVWVQARHPPFLHSRNLGLHFLAMLVTARKHTRTHTNTQTHKDVRFFKLENASDCSEGVATPPTVTDPPVIPCMVISLPHQKRTQNQCTHKAQNVKTQYSSCVYSSSTAAFRTVQQQQNSHTTVQQQYSSSTAAVQQQYSSSTAAQLTILAMMSNA
jgi:hypothetical protein